MKKKHLALFINDLRSFNQILTTHEFLFQKICENFEKLFIISIENLCFFSSGTSGFNNKDFFFDKKKRKLIVINKNLKLPNNIEFFQPLDANDFKKLMFDKDIIGINSFGRTLKELKAHFLLKKYNIKQIQISNLGNIQTQIVPIKNTFWKAWIYKFQHDFGHKLTVLLSNFGMVSKIDIRFESNKELINNLKLTKGIKSFLFKKFNLFYCKKHILVNSNSYDIIASSKPTIREEKIVLLDIMFDHEERIAMGSNLVAKDTKDFHFRMKKLLNYLSKVYKKKVVVCIHPKDNLNKKKKIYSNYRVVKYASKKNIFKAFLVIFFDTSAITDAIFLKKKIIAITSKVMDKNQISQALDYHYKAGIIKINLEDYSIKNKKELLYKLNKAKKKYFKYNKNFLVPDGKNFGYKKVIKIVKNNFF
jgi:hypothetical protein